MDDFITVTLSRAVHKRGICMRQKEAALECSGPQQDAPGEEQWTLSWKVGISERQA